MITLPPIDKCLHFMAGVLIYGIGHFISPIIGLTAVTIVGIGKEIYDYYNPPHQPDILDLIYTLAGGLTGFICGL